MNLVSVVSSNVSEIGYDNETCRLVVRFKSGSAYEYLEVPADVHASLMAAGSTGNYLARQIVHSGLYEYRKLRPEEIELLPTPTISERVGGTTDTLVPRSEVGADHAGQPAGRDRY